MESPYILSDDNFNNLPELIKESCIHFNGRERETVFLSIIGCISSVLPNVEFRYDKNTYYPNLSIFTIAPSGIGKGVMKHGKNLINPIHMELLSSSMEVYEQAKRNRLPLPTATGKTLPGNTTSAAIYKQLNESEDGLLIFETEADSLTQSLNSEHGGFSDILRKVFAHETMSKVISQDNLRIEIDQPKLSMVLSGTPDQIHSLVNNVNNGLFSRIVYYKFTERKLKKMGPEENSFNIDSIIEHKSREIHELYNILKNRTQPLTVKFNQGQYDLLNGFNERFFDILNKTENDVFLGSTNRFGVIWWRIALILTILRQKNNLNLSEINELQCDDIDFLIAHDIVENLVEHSFDLFQQMNKSKSYKFKSLRDQNTFNNLPNEFNRKDIIPFLSGWNMPQRTFDLKLKEWCSLDLLIKEQAGIYKKKK